MRGLVVLTVAALLFAGCLGGVGSSNTSIAGQGTKEGTVTKNLKCDEDGQIAIGIQGQGRVTVVVTDGNGASIFQQSFNGQGQEGENSAISGAAGDWTLRADFASSSGMQFGSDSFQGQWGITLSC